MCGGMPGSQYAVCHMQGLGKALVRELLLEGDRVLLTSRTQVCCSMYTHV